MPDTISSFALAAAANPDSGRTYQMIGYDYLREPLNSLAPRMVIQKGAQVGATVMAMLRTMWILQRQQRSAMYLFPTHRTADRFRRGRFNVMVQRSPLFREIVKATGAPGHLSIGVAQFYCHGARSRAELMSVPVAYLTLDERDELYRIAGMQDTPWSAVDLARQRLAGQPDSWEFSLSTPTIPGYGIAAEFEASDQRDFIIRCCCCSQSTRLSWPAAVMGVDGPPSRARFGCPLCRQLWKPRQRREMIQAGAWQARYAGRATQGFHLSQLLSPVARPATLVQQWQNAQGDPAALQVFHNSVLGLPYLAEGARLEMSRIASAIARSSGATMATSAVHSCAGIDVGPHYLHVVIARAEHGMCCILWAGVALHWAELARLLENFHVRSYVIDAQPETHEARRLVHQRPGGWMCYYGNTQIAQPHQDTALHILRAPRSESLDNLYHAWNQEKVIAPTNLPVDFADHLRSPVRVVRQDRKGQPHVDYLQAGGPDHYAHAMNYCLLAMGMLGQQTAMHILS